MPIKSPHSAGQPANPSPDTSRWGAASRFQFDDPNKWVTVESVPLLDEHELTSDDGRVIATVDRAALEEIARNNNAKVRDTGDPATLILGHTSDDPRAPEKPAQGFVVNYNVKPFKRAEDGRVVYAIHGDYKLRPNKAHLVEEYPRRSVELWWYKKDIDPIAMLGGSSPERDLGAMIRYTRLNHVALAHNPTTGIRDVNRASDADVIQFHRRGQWTIENYAIDPTLYSKVPMNSKNGRGKPTNRYNCAPGKMKYAEDDLDPGMDTHDTGDEGVDTDGVDGGADDFTGSQDDDVGGNESPAVRELLQSKAFRDLQSKIDQLFTMLTGGDGADPGDPGLGGVGGDDSMPGEMPPPGGGMDAPGGAPPMSPGPDAPGGAPPLEEESRREMGERPVQMGAGPTGFPGQSNTMIPDFGGKPSKRLSRTPQSRGNNRGTPMTATERALQEKVARLERRDKESRLRYAQSEAARRVEQLVSEGYLFGPTPAEHDEGVAETKQHFANLLASAPDDTEGNADVDYEESIIRRRYSRKRPDPTRVGQAGLSRYTRDPVQEGAKQRAEAPFEFESDEESCQFADLVTGNNTPGRKRYSEDEAKKVILYRRQQRR